MSEEPRPQSFFDYLSSNPSLFLELFETHKTNFLEWKKLFDPKTIPPENATDDDKTKESSTSWNESPNIVFLQETISTQPLFLDPEKTNRYQVLETLGTGGMGVVERVQDTLLDREVAWKKIKQQNSKLLSPREQLRLWRLNQEAKITAILEHPNIVPLYDMRILLSGETTFIMRKVEGDTLSSLLQKNKATVKKGKPILGEPQLFSIFFKVCDAVAYAHSRNIVHRDLKPDNIMVGKFGEVYVMDWGIAKRLQDAPEKSGAVEIDSGALHTIGGIGTPGYMPPEQKDNASKVTPQADIYALGKILRQCYIGSSPVEEFRELLKNYQQSETPEIDPRKQSLPSDILAILEKATAPKPEDRYVSVEEMKSDLERYLNHFRVSVREYSLWEVLQKWGKRYQKNLKMIAISSIVLFSIFWSINWIQYQERLKKYHNRLQYWLERLKNPHPREKELARVEISKMNEDQILNRLLEVLAEGTSYFLQHEKRSPKQDEYYLLLPELIGALQNPKARDALLNALTQMKEKLVLIPVPKRIMEEELYMVALTDSLIQSKAKNIAILLDQIRHQIGSHGIYYQRSESLFRQIIMEEYLETPKNLDDRYYFYQAKIKEFLNDYPAAILFYNEYIRLKPYEPFGFFYRGYCYSQIQNFQAALADMTRAIQLNTTDYMAHVSRGAIKAYLGDFVGAEADFEKALLSRPREADIYLARGKARFLFKKDNELAMADLNEAIRLYPQFDEAYYFRGKLKSNILDNRGAINDFSKALQLNSKYVDAYVYRGGIYTEEKEFDKALHDFEEARRLDPQLDRVYYGLGSVAFQQKRYSAALDYFNEALRLKSCSTETLNNRALTKIEINDFKGALDDYNELIQIDPKNKQAYWNRACLQYQLKNYSLAIEDCERYILFAPESPNGYGLRGNVWASCAEWEKAIQDYTQAIRYAPEISKSYHDRAMSWIELKNAEKAMQDLNEAIRLTPEDSKYYGTRGNLKSNLNDLDGALADYTNLLRLNPYDVLAYDNRGMLYLRFDKLELAMKDFQEAIRLNPEFAPAYNHRAILKTRQNHLIVEAIEDFKIAIQLYEKDKKSPLKTDRERFQRASCYYNLANCHLQIKSIPEAILLMEQGVEIFPDPKAVQLLCDLLLQRMSEHYRQKKYELAKEDLIRFQRYATPAHPKYEQIQKMLQQIEAQLNK